MIKNKLILKMPSLASSVKNVTEPTMIGPIKAANFPNILYIPKNSLSLPSGTKDEKYDLLNA